MQNSSAVLPQSHVMNVYAIAHLDFTGFGSRNQRQNHGVAEERQRLPPSLRISLLALHVAPSWTRCRCKLLQRRLWQWVGHDQCHRVPIAGYRIGAYIALYNCTIFRSVTKTKFCARAQRGRPRIQTNQAQTLSCYLSHVLSACMHDVWSEFSTYQYIHDFITTIVSTADFPSNCVFTYIISMSLTKLTRVRKPEARNRTV